MSLYELLPGESINQLASRFGLSPDIILEANGLTDSSLLEPGIMYYIPSPPALQSFPWPVDITNAGLNIVDGFLYTLYTDRPHYLPGQPVYIMFIKTNISPCPIRLVYPTSQRFDITVVQNDREIWRWSKDRIFLPAVAVCELLPGQSEVYSVVWHQNGNNELGIEPGPGLFTLRAKNTAAELGDEEVELRLRIQQPTASVEQDP